MNSPQRLFFTVTNDLTYDQRMHRICTALSAEGYDITLIGRVLPHSLPLAERPFRQIRLRCWKHKGFAFYAEFNIRLFFFLWKNTFDGVCTVDLDTMPATCTVAVLKNKTRFFDAHEYFTEVPEVTHRPVVKAFWALIALVFTPFYHKAYTVGPALARIFTEKYKIPFQVVRNVPEPQHTETPVTTDQKILLYQGALNEGRGIEALIDAIPLLPDYFVLWLAGEGDCSQDLRARADALNLGERIRFLGFVQPADLRNLTHQAWLGMNLLENRGLSYYYSLANKFFDYVQVGVPLVTMNFPEYAALNAQYEVAILLDRLSPALVANSILEVEKDADKYRFLQENCRKEALEWHWQKEKQVLLDIYRRS